jgi:phytoene/squalene synthetase
MIPIQFPFVSSTVAGSLAQAYAACEALARSHYENFPVASMLLPKGMRPHIAAVYAFARRADDMADEGDAAAADRRAALDSWQRRLHRAVESPVIDVPTADDLMLMAATTSSARSRRIP